MGRKNSYRFPFAVYPAVRIFIFLAAGISSANLFAPDPPVLAGVSGGVMILWLLFEFQIRKTHQLFAARAATVCYKLIIFLTGMMLFSLAEKNRQQQIQNTAPINLYTWEEVTVEGKILHTGRSSSGSPVYIVHVNNTRLPEGKVWQHDYKIRVYAASEQAGWQAGQTIKADIELYEFPERRNPVEFNYGHWLHQQEIMAHGELKSVTVKEDISFGWETVRGYVQRNVDRTFKKQHASLVKALVLGYKEELTPETKQQFSRAGLSHIMAVSGLHVGFIVAPFWFMIPYFWGSNKGRWSGLLFLTLLLIGYAGLTGFSASVCRASLMAWFLTCGRLFHKIRNSVNLTATAAIVLLLINPRQLFDVGFQLSFSAVFIILLVMPEAQRLIPVKYRFSKSGGLLTIVLVSIVVQAGLFPLLIYYFGEFSIMGPAANALVVPVLSVTVPVALLFSLAGPVNVAAYNLATVPVQYSVDWIYSTAVNLGSLESSYISMDHQSVCLFLIWILAVFCIASLRLPSIRWKLVAGLLLAVNLFWVESSLKKGVHKTMEVTFLDVGQGDAAHIKTPGGKHILIDTGVWTPGSNSGERVLLPYFEAMGIDNIDAMILSHPHADHIGGAAAVIGNKPVHRIYQSNYTYDSSLFHQYTEQAQNHNVTLITPSAGDILNIDPALRIFVLGPERSGPRNSNPNNHSLILKIVYGETSLLFSGDAEKEQEAHVTGKYEDFLKTDIYKVGHHASNTSSTEPFIIYVKPEVAIASLAFQNRFSHPGKETINRLAQNSTEQMFTSLTGAIRYSSDGKEFKLLDW